jgi:tetratricopeptide (TPR) repeat protein
MKFGKAAARRFTTRVGVFAGALLFFLGLASELFARKQNVLEDPLKRKQVSELFEKGKRLEALPLAEELVKANPRDDQMMVILAACLVDHAATLTDQNAAGKERLRARVLLNAAWDLGNTSPLALNLGQLLKQLPDNGAIKFSDNPQADQAIREGEAAFSREDYDGARKNYTEALRWEPASYTAALFIGNTYDRQNQPTKAAEWYGRAVGFDPDTETAYRYYADLLARNGEMAEARTMLIHATVAEPYNRIVWRELRAWATLNHTEIREVYVSVPPAPKSAATDKSEDQFAKAWAAYRRVRESWHNGVEFQKQFPEEKEYRHSVKEEMEALKAAVEVAEEQAKKEAGLEIRSADPAIALLLQLSRADMLAPYVLFSLGDQGIAWDYNAYRRKNREKLERYLNDFVVPPAP